MAAQPHPRTQDHGASNKEITVTETKHVMITAQSGGPSPVRRMGLSCPLAEPRSIQEIWRPRLRRLLHASIAHTNHPAAMATMVPNSRQVHVVVHSWLTAIALCPLCSVLPQRLTHLSGVQHRCIRRWVSDGR